MPVEPRNLLFLFSDQHNRAMAGCYGHPVVRTPNLDALAARGVRFTDAYSNCPICVPSRASMATGRYVHQLRLWDNAFPYTGQAPSWGHRLTDAGHRVTTIGKLHFRGPGDDTGFPDQRIPMHVLDGEGDLSALLRDEDIPRPAFARVLDPRTGESSYTAYDRAIADEACRWLDGAASHGGEPWALFCSFTLPHHPLIAPREFVDLYPPEHVAFPARYRLDERPTHPALEHLRRTLGIEGEWDEDRVRRAVATYYAMCTFLDAQIGRVLRALRDTGLDRTTRVIYSSDHGDSVGEHGLWMKHSMYEGSVGIPLLMAGPGIPQGRVLGGPVSLVDCFPTILQCAGVPPRPEDADLPGRSLFDRLGSDPPPAAVAFSEYHAVGSRNAVFMLRGRRYKYVEYVGQEPQLFDLLGDPGELRDLARDPGHRHVLDGCAAQLRRICDPIEVDRLARRDQLDKVDAHGGREAVRAEGFRIPYTPAPFGFAGVDTGGNAPD
jgi:choline-sulfatase